MTNYGHIVGEIIKVSKPIYCTHGIAYRVVARTNEGLLNFITDVECKKGECHIIAYDEEIQWADIDDYLEVNMEEDN